MPMTEPLPLEGDTSWYAWATEIHADVNGLGTAATTAATAYEVAGAAAAAQAASQPLDADLTTIAAANNGSVLAATTASFLTADETKLDGIEALADVTDTTNVTAAGALMDSEVTNLAAVKAFAAADYATAAQGTTADGAIAKSLVDAKGDILAATAADTVARLAVSVTNGHVLTVDSAEATGLKWAAAAAGGVTLGAARTVGGTRIAVPGATFTSVGAFTRPADLQNYLPFIVDTATTVDAVLCEVTANATAGTVRLGIYNADTDWQPTTLVQDAGTVDPSTTGVKTASFAAVVLAAGRYLIAFATSTATPTFRMARGSLSLGVVNPGLGANLLFVQASVAAVGTAALASPGVQWSNFGGDTSPMVYPAFLRITGV